MILTKNQGRSKEDKEGMRIRKSRYVELDKTHCCTGNFNAALSLYGILGVALYLFKGFLEAAAGELAVLGESAVFEALWPLEVTMVYFLEQESNLWSPVL